MFAHAVSIHGSSDIYLRTVRLLSNTNTVEKSRVIVHFTVVCLVAKRLYRSEAGVNFVVIQTLLLLICKSFCYHAN